MDYETQQVRVALSGTPLLVMEEGDEEDFTPFVDLCRMAARLFKENLTVIGWFIGLSVLILLGIIFFFSVASWMVGNQWIGLLISLPLLLFVGAPVISLAKHRLALNIWDEGQASPLDAFRYAADNLTEAIAIFWQSVYYDADLLFRLTISVAPSVLAGLAVISVLNEFKVQSAYSWGVMVSAVMIGLMLAFYVWHRARRILTFLPAFNAFEKIDGQSGYWGIRCELMYHWLTKKRYIATLNIALLAALPIILVSGGLLALIISLWLPPLVTVYLLVLLPFTVRLAGNLWYDIMAAGYYRYNFIPEPI